MFRNVFGGGKEREGQREGQGSNKPANPKPQEGQGATIGDIFYDAAVEAAERAPQPPTGGFRPVDSDVFLSEGSEQRRQAGEPHLPGQQRQQQAPDYQQPYQPPAQPGQQIFIPKDYQTPAQLRSQYERQKENRNRLMSRLRAASEQDASKNPYAVVGANGKSEFNQSAYNNDQLDYSKLDSDMRETWHLIQEAERASGDVVEQVRKAANRYYQQQFAGRSASEALQRATGTLFARHVQQLITSGFLLDANNLSSAALDSHFRNVFFAALGEATAQVGSGLGPAGSGRSAGQTDSDPERDPEDPYADFPDEGKRIMEAFHRSQGTKPKTLAEAARQEREANEPRGGSR